MKETGITFKQWKEEMLADIDAFEKTWKQKQAEDSDNYPNRLYRGDWDEQFSLMQKDAEK